MVRHFVQNPLPSSFMLISMVGFIVSTTIVWNISMTWGFTFTTMFTIWFIASVYNFTHAPDIDELDIHDSEILWRKSPLHKK